MSKQPKDRSLDDRYFDVACVECGADIGTPCVVMSKGFAGRSAPRPLNRVRSPHPSRKATSRNE